MSTETTITKGAAQRRLFSFAGEMGAQIVSLLHRCVELAINGLEFIGKTASSLSLVGEVYGKPTDIELVHKYLYDK